MGIDLYTTIEGIDKKVGKKYSNGSYGNDITIQIRGNFDDAAGSGVSMIYYKVYPTEADILNEISGVSDITQLTDANLKTLTGKVIESPTGKFAPLEKNVKQRIFYNVKVTKETDNRLHGKVYKRRFIETHNITFCAESSYLNEDIGFNRACRYLTNNTSKSNTC